jgi:hypothetical protein
MIFNAPNVERKEKSLSTIKNLVSIKLCVATDTMSP